MDVNNMKVTDLKKELKSRGLSIIGNKSELIGRLKEAICALTTNDSPLDNNNTEHNEDSALEDQLLGEESAADETISKTDDHLIDDLLDTNGTKDVIKAVGKEGSKLINNKSPTKATPVTVSKTNTNPSSPTKSVTDQTLKPNDSVESKLKTVTAVKILSAEERKELRSQKFGDSKLNERANRFGLKADQTNSVTNPSNIDEKLQKRAQRFGAIVSEKMKKIDDNQKLLKRKERFGVKTISNVKTTTTSTTNADITGASKRKIVFSANDGNEQKQKRLQRFGKFL